MTEHDGKQTAVSMGTGAASPVPATSDRFWFHRKNPKRNPAYWERKRARDKERRRVHREATGTSYYAAYRRMEKYGLSSDAYAAMVAAQDGRCAICRQETKLTVDHDHVTGEVRGLLCYHCNLGLMAVDRCAGWPNAARKYLNHE